MDASNLFAVKGKTVLITGGAKGIGRMIAEGFVANGAKVYLTGREAKALDQAVAELSPIAQAYHAKTLDDAVDGRSTSTQAQDAPLPVAIPANLQDLKACEALVQRLTELEPNGLHCLLLNAGATWGASIDEYPDAAWTKVLTLNLQRSFTLTQLCLPLLSQAARPDDPARIIHIGSIDGVRAPVVNNYAYSASKAGLHHLSQHLARDLGPRGITSNVLACGPFPTKMMKATLDTMGDVIRSELPLGRVGKPEDVAGASLFLASKAGAFVNGALIRVDGGASLVSKL